MSRRGAGRDGAAHDRSRTGRRSRSPPRSRRWPAASTGRWSSSGTCAPSGPRRSCGRASSPRSRTSCGPRSRSSPATSTACSAWAGRRRPSGGRWSGSASRPRACRPSWTSCSTSRSSSTRASRSTARGSSVAELLDAVIGGLGEWPGMPPVHVDGARRPARRPRGRGAHRPRPGRTSSTTRAATAGPGSIEIRARRQRSTVVITVEDEGPGIPPDERALVFDRLYRGRAARDAAPRGHRHGPPRLPSPRRGARRADLDRARAGPQRRLLQPPGRRAGATSRVGEPGEPGLAVRPGDGRAIPGRSPDRAAARARSRPCPGHGELVLIVEDEPEFRELVELWVSRHGWRTATAADGLEVMRRFEEEAPDLVLLDLNLPGMDGWEVTEWIRRVSSVPILMVTAHGIGGRRRPRPRQRAPTTTSPSPSGCPSSWPGSPRPCAACASPAAGPRDDAHRASRACGSSPRPHRVVGEATEVHLTPTEFRLLVTLARHPGILREPRGAAAWRLGTHLRRGDAGPAGHDAQPARRSWPLRRPGRTFIVTEYGLGYRFQPGPERAGVPRSPSARIARVPSSHRPPVSLPRPRALGAPS